MAYKIDAKANDFELSAEEIRAMRVDVQNRMRSVDVMILIKDHGKGAHQRIREMLYQRYMMQNRADPVWGRLQDHCQRYCLPKIVIDQVFRAVL